MVPGLTPTHVLPPTAHNLDGVDIPGPLEPLANVLLVKVKDAADVSAGGIVLPDQVCGGWEGGNAMDGGSEREWHVLYGALRGVLVLIPLLSYHAKKKYHQAKEKPTEGEVIAAGPGRQHPETGVLMPMPVKAGTF